MRAQFCLVLLSGSVAVFNVTAAQAGDDVESVLVIGTSPADARQIGPDEVASSHALTASDLVNDQVASVFLSDTESSPFQEDLYFRGFDASPVLGTPEGLAVYQNGTRINQRFGDTVLWDLMPSFAIARVDVVPGSDPLFGLNALGGAIVFDMKPGFDSSSGVQLNVAGGSFGRALAVAQMADHTDSHAFYVGVSAVDDSGWRRSSASKLYQAYGDFALRSQKASFGVDLALASDLLNENGAVPVQDNVHAAFAIPDTARNADLLLQTRGEYDFDVQTILRGNSWLRATHIQTANGQASGFSACAGQPSILCDSNGDPLQTTSGVPIPSKLGGVGTVGAETIATTAIGATLEVDHSGSLLGRSNSIVLGDSFDYATTGFGSTTALGNLTLQNGGSTAQPIGIDLGGPDWNVRLGAVSFDEGLFAQDTIALTAALSLELSARFQLDRIDLRDRLGTSLTGGHAYAGLNPAAELSWVFSDGVAAYAEFEQSSRTPTPAELSCANSAQPCLFPLSFISDPPLRQVIARTLEMGAKGQTGFDVVSVDWSADIYGTRNQDDILFESSGPSIGSGYFANVGTTQRLGAEIAAVAKWERFDLRASYGYVNATFESAFAEQSPNNPAADANGNILVKPGDRLANIPRSTAKLSLAYAASPALRLVLGAHAESSQYLRGDEANIQSPLPGYVTFNAEADYQLSSRFQLYLEGENIFDRHYATFGLYGDPTGHATFPQFTNPRFIVPAAPLAMWIGLRATF